MKPSKLRVFERRSPVKVLGPYARAVIWVQGCDFGCKGCIVPESWDRDSGEEVDISELVAWVLSQSNIEGVTLSGGEPMLQAEALSTLIDQIREVRDLGVMCYTGYRIEYLKSQGDIAQKLLLTKIDLLVEGMYQENLQDDLLWRGSNNQRLLLLSDRYRDFLQSQSDRSAGLEFFLNETGEVGFSGVPAQPNFRREFESQMSQRSVIVNPQ
ncbi:4Fe-4S single cluster domain-containing protein [Prochlorothrix hollandica]|uniref:Ribonucleotide reductase n=1 Tax=Prochlorothrix hollandica PCC 9006 = CALU 1027 TaxID=317619 RepID=A0A0M2PV31_PROHO|nr:4Fe-4S cluster-binding domain-containing protein [Prochlorothrix hollandica]KKI98226.1 ribonucleotide reductase [Prochlorothrix hollandica PCC 9006 = CALU 1027]